MDTKEYKRKWNNERRFGGLREIALERDQWKCQVCGRPWDADSRSICVHHLDHNPKNNVLDNLATLCRSCHPIAHGPWSEERRRQHSEIMKRIGSGKWMNGRTLSEETRDKIGAANHGHKHSPKSIEKMRQAKRDWWIKQPPERKTAIGQKRRGHISTRSKTPGSNRHELPAPAQHQ